jgi:hypothetical protein
VENEPDVDIENLREKVKRINKAFSRVHAYDNQAIIEGAGDHENTLKHHIKTIKEELFFGLNKKAFGLTEA